MDSGKSKPISLLRSTNEFEHPKRTQQMSELSSYSSDNFESQFKAGSHTYTRQSIRSAQTHDHELINQLDSGKQDEVEQHILDNNTGTNTMGNNPMGTNSMGTSTMGVNTMGTDNMGTNTMVTTNDPQATANESQSFLTTGTTSDYNTMYENYSTMRMPQISSQSNNYGYSQVTSGSINEQSSNTVTSPWMRFAITEPSVAYTVESGE